jgi:large subunit ribosomal protein L5
MTDTATTSRLKTRYLEEIRPALIERFGYSSVMQAPKLEKITLNMGVGLAKQDSKMLKAARDQLATIAGQQPSVRRARKSIAAFKLREGMPVGVAVTLRAERGYEFLDRLVSIAIPRIRDFRGLNPRSFDGRGNYTLGVKEQIIFPEIDYDAIDQVRGLDITITTSAETDAEAFALLEAMGMPFATQGRPKDFGDPTDDAGEDDETTADSPPAQATTEAPAEDEQAVGGQATTEAPAEDEQAVGGQATTEAPAEDEQAAGGQATTEAPDDDDEATTDSAGDGEQAGGDAEAEQEGAEATAEQATAEAPAEQATTETPAADEEAADLPAGQADGDADATVEQTDALDEQESAHTAEKESTD